MEFHQFVFLSFNSYVCALDRDTGTVVWNWKSPKGSGFVATLLDGDRLIVSVDGYTYCLDPNSGEQLWNNPLDGFGMGVPCLTSVRGNTILNSAGEAERQWQRRKQDS